MSKRFGTEMAEAAELPVESIPRLRLSIDSGADVRVVLPNRNIDWVGDSVRTSNRASNYCEPNEVLIGHSASRLVFRDFELEEIPWPELSKRPVKKESEEKLVVHRLNGIKDEPGNIPAYIYTLHVLGRHEAATQTNKRTIVELVDETKKSCLIRDRVALSDSVIAVLGDKTKKTGAAVESRSTSTIIRWNRLIAAQTYNEALLTLDRMKAVGLHPDVVTYSTLINLAKDYATGQEVLKQMREDGVLPDVVTYSTLINLGKDYATGQELLKQMREDGVPPNVVTYSTLINLGKDYATGQELLKQMREDGVLPNVVTYNTLINLGKDYATGQELLKQMREDGVLPDVVTYNTLINLAKDYATGEKLLKQMREDGVLPDVVTYNTLINLAKDYATGQELLKQMREDGVLPDVVTYTTLFSKDLGDRPADEILRWYLAQPFHAEKGIEALISQYRRMGRDEQAMRIALDYPHNDAAIRFIHDNTSKAITHFETLWKRDPNHRNAAYALGIAMMVGGRDTEAKDYLLKAMKLATSLSRQLDIQERLERISSS
jgi:tetratricopeptide (TPR) repeat protein